MDIQKAFSHDNKQKLDGLLEVIVSSALGDSKPVDSDRSVDEIFDRLSTAAQAGDRDIFRQLVAAERQSRKENSPTLLMSAVISGKTEIVRELVAAGANVSDRSVFCTKLLFLYPMPYALTPS